MFHSFRLHGQARTLGFMTALALGLPATGLAQTASPAAETKLHISAEGTVQAPPDQITATFRVEAQGKSPAAAQQSVNAQISRAMATSSKVKGLKSAALNYSVSQTRPDKARPFWTAQQSLTLTASDGQALLPLAGELQASGLILEGLEWSLSESRRQGLLLEAEKNAVTDLQKQAETLAASLGLHVARFETLNFSEFTPIRPMPVMMMAARSSADTTPPSSTEETQTVRARGNATVILTH